MSYPARQFHRKPAPTRAENRTALRAMLTMRRRDKPPSDADFASYERCYGVKADDARVMWADVVGARI